MSGVDRDAHILGKPEPHIMLLQFRQNRVIITVMVLEVEPHFAHKHKHVSLNMYSQYMTTPTFTTLVVAAAATVCSLNTTL